MENKVEIKWDNYVEVDETDYARYDLSDTVMIRQSHYQPRYFVQRNSKGTREKQREVVERVFLTLKKGTEEVVERGNKEEMFKHFSRFLNLQREFPCVCMTELDVFVEGVKGIIDILRGSENGNKK